MLPAILLLLVACNDNQVSSAHETICIYETTNICDDCTILYDMKNLTKIKSNRAAEMTICINDIKLQKPLEISDKISLVIFGFGNTFECTRGKSDTGLYLENITDLFVHDITIANCGGMERNIHYHQLGTIKCSMLIINCTNISIRDVTIVNSTNTGLMMLNNSGQIIVNRSYFFNNGHRNDGNQFTELNDGGGLSIVLDEEYNIEILSCEFMNNMAKRGGAVNVLHYYTDITSPNNSLLVHGSKFFENIATLGGGVRIEFQSMRNQTQGKAKNSIIFAHCTWTKNIALAGAAMDCVSKNNRISDTVPGVHLIDCSYTSNDIGYSQNEPYHGAGALWINTVNIFLQGKNNFTNNNNTAIYVKSAKVSFQSGSRVRFSENRGIKGGAIHLSDPSVIIIDDNSTFTFSNNKATEKGGAIYHLLDEFNDFSSPINCFLQYGGEEEVSNRNIEFIFENNSIENPKSENSASIYLVTIKPCEHYSNCSGIISLSCIANFSFTKEISQEISSSGNQFDIIQDTLDVLPGYRKQLPIKLLNDLSKEIPAQYSVSIISNTSSISVDEAYAVTSHNWIRLAGKQGSSGTLKLVYSDIKTIITEINVTLMDCPPGYIWIKETEMCACSVNEKEENRYECIHSCNDSTQIAQIERGYWMGFIQNNKDEEFGKEDDLVYAYCPLSNCFSESKRQRRHNLQDNTSLHHLDHLICGKTRTGKLCSFRRGNNTVHFNSYQFTCKEDNSCSLGWLYYILSEIVPVTILFLIVIIFDIELTKGAVNGLILYLQISDNTLKEVEFEVHSPILIKIIDVYKSITQIFNLNFFEFEETSFCIWKEAKVIDIIAFKYITALYSLLLVIAVILVMKFCYGRRMRCTSATCKLCGKHNIGVRGTIIRGISSFLILSYSKCIKISIRLLTAVPLYKKGGEIYEIVSFYDGNLTFFQGLHLVYALPAILIILTLGVIPPMLLISYPACYRLLALFKINETKFSTCLCKIVPLEKLKPFFDFFQQSFKDEYRFFSGLYFVYRIILVAPFMLVYDTAYFYLSTQIGLALIFTVHAIFQPYKNKWHNFSDGLLLMVLLIVNAMAALSYHTLFRVLKGENYATAFSSIGIALLYTPFVRIVIYYCKMIAYKLRNKYLAYERRSSDYVEYNASNSILLEAAEERIAEMLND